MSTTGAQDGAASTEGLGLVPKRWYVVSRDGLATLCKDEADARRYAPECDRMYKSAAPHRAALLGDVAAERERCAKKPLTDDQIKAAITIGVQSGQVSWMGFEKGPDGQYTRPSLSKQHYQIARAIERALGIGA